MKNMRHIAAVLIAALMVSMPAFALAHGGNHGGEHENGCDDGNHHYSASYTYKCADNMQHTTYRHRTCSDCSKETDSHYLKDHTNCWKETAEGTFKYRCKYCRHVKTKGGVKILDYDCTSSHSVTKGHSKALKVRYYHSTCNKVKSVSCSNTRCTASIDGGKVIIKGKKKGSCTVRIYMKSGAVHTCRMKVA